MSDDIELSPLAKEVIALRARLAEATAAIERLTRERDGACEGDAIATAEFLHWHNDAIKECERANAAEAALAKAREDRDSHQRAAIATGLELAKARKALTRLERLVTFDLGDNATREPWARTLIMIRAARAPEGK